MPKIELKAGDIVKVLSGPYAGSVTVVARKEDGRRECGRLYLGSSWVLAEFIVGLPETYKLRYIRIRPEHHDDKHLEKVGRVSRLDAG